MRDKKSQPLTASDQPPAACWCAAKGRDECTCEVPFIGNQAEADRRVKDGTLEALWDETNTLYLVPPSAIRVALINDLARGDPRLTLAAPVAQG